MKWEQSEIREEGRHQIAWGLVSWAGSLNFILSRRVTSLDLCFKKHMTVLWEMDFGENGINQGV